MNFASALPPNSAILLFTITTIPSQPFHHSFTWIPILSTYSQSLPSYPFIELLSFPLIPKHFPLSINTNSYYFPLFPITFPTYQFTISTNPIRLLLPIPFSTPLFPTYKVFIPFNNQFIPSPVQSQFYLTSVQTNTIYSIHCPIYSSFTLFIFQMFTSSSRKSYQFHSVL